jgi:hypothetical protein
MWVVFAIVWAPHTAPSGATPGSPRGCGLCLASYNRCMPDAQVNSAFLQRRLHQLGLDEVPAVAAAAWLDEAGLLRDSPTRPGLPLRTLLRAGTIPQGEQRPPFRNGRWFIRDRGGIAGRQLSRSASRTSHPGHDDADSTRLGGRVESATDPSMTTERGGLGEVSVAKYDGGHTDTFTRAGLTARGLVGFERFKSIALDRVPLQPGVYVVLRDKDSRPVFLDRSPAGWFKGQNPTVPGAELEGAWPDGAIVSISGRRAPEARAGAVFASGSRSSAITATAARWGIRAVVESGNSLTPMNMSSPGCPRLAAILRSWRRN